MKKIFFDEAGYSGNNLHDEEQPCFCYLGLISSDEIEQDFLDLKKKYGYGEILHVIKVYLFYDCPKLLLWA